MAKIRVAINGYGRIGRMAHRVILERFADKAQIVAINVGSSTDLAGWMYLLKYDTAYGPLKNHSLSLSTSNVEGRVGQITYLGDFIIDEVAIPIFKGAGLNGLPYSTLSVDVVIESTGQYTTKEELQCHIDAGARSAVLSAPFKNDGMSTYILGVNYPTKDVDKIISNASCTTNCITPVAQIIDEHLGIEKAMMTTIHAFTSDQRLQDGGHKDYRRARAANQNIVPTSSGATKAVENTIPNLKGLFGGMAIRVPILTGSMSDFTFLVKKETTKEEINSIFETASKTQRYHNILAVTRDPIVSSDIIGDLHSSIVDLTLTQVVGKTMVKVVAWYDNEYAYANRLVESALILGSST